MERAGPVIQSKKAKGGPPREQFKEFTAKMEDEEQQLRIDQVQNWTRQTFPQLEPRFARGHPVFTHYGTFIISYSPAKKHLAVSPELAQLDHFSDKITKAGCSRGTMVLRMPWVEPVDFDLLRQIIEFNLKDKIDCATFWRKPEPKA